MKTKSVTPDLWIVTALNALGAAFIAALILLALALSSCAWTPERDSQGRETGRETLQPPPVVKQVIETVGPMADKATGFPVTETALGGLALVTALLGFLTVREKKKVTAARAETEEAQSDAERFERAAKLAVLSVEAQPEAIKKAVKETAKDSPLSDETTRATIRELKGA